MTQPGPAVPKCPLCPRVRRPDRPLCNRDFRHAGPEVINRYVARLKTAQHDPDDRAAQNRLAETIDQMIANARRYDNIKATGFHPFWNAERQRWDHPRERAAAILKRWYLKHRFYLDPENDKVALDQIAAELVPQNQYR